MKERRSFEKSAAMRVMDTLIVSGWALMPIGALIFSKAMPVVNEDMFSRIFAIGISYYGWDKNLLLIAFSIIGLVALMSLVALLLHMRQKRRKEDKLKKSLLALMPVSLLSFIFMLLKFRSLFY